MAFFARMGSPLGGILIRSDGTALTGLFFTDQKDCPPLQGTPPSPSRNPDPTAGVRAGLPIKNFKLHRPGIQTSLFEPPCIPQTTGPAGGQDDEGMVTCVADPAAGELAILQDETPAGALRVFDQTRTELDEYFTGARRTSSTPLMLHGTEFQKRIWAALLAIPYGEYISYADVARAAGLSAKHGRPVGTAVGRNPVAIIVPCHRVLSSAGTLNGYTGGLDRKLALLEIEGYALG